MIQLHHAQSEPLRYLLSNPVAYAAVTATRGFGKSYLAVTAAVAGLKYLFEKPNLENRRIYIIGPTWDQTLKIYYPLLSQKFKLAKWGSSHTGTFSFKDGTTLQLASYEAIERIRGLGVFLAVMDEVTTWAGRPGLREAWEGIIQPAMTTRHPDEHRALMITTPKGKDEYYDLVTGGSFRHFKYTYEDAPHLSLKAIENARRTLDPLTFAREYLASFEESGARVFYAFSDKCVTEDIVVLPTETIHCAIDFNVGIQATSYWVIRNNNPICVGDELGSTNTYELVQAMRRRWPRNSLIAYPDPSGKARKTSAPTGVTDHSIIQASGIPVMSRQAHPPIVDSVAAVNSLFYHGRAFVCKSASRVIKSLDRTSWVDGRPDRAEIDKSRGVEHYSDGVRYFFEYMWPIRSGLINSLPGGFL